MIGNKLNNNVSRWILIKKTIINIHIASNNEFKWYRFDIVFCIGCLLANRYINTLYIH